MSIIRISAILDFLETKKYTYTFYGDNSMCIEGFSSLNNIKRGSIFWIKRQSAWDTLLNKGLNKLDFVDSLVVVQEGIELDVNNRIVASNSKAIFFDILGNFFDDRSRIDSTVIGKNSVVEETVVLGNRVKLGHNCSITGNVIIGDDTIIDNNVVITGPVSVGRKCHIQSLVTIGIDGFGVSEDADMIKHMVPHFGGVKIGDNVFIGSHTNVSRGTLDDTIIGNNVKIGTSCFIAHNTNIGDNSVVICSNILGSSTLGEDSYVVSSTIRNQKTLGKHSAVGMGSVVTKDIPDSVLVIGTPAKIIREHNGGMIS